MKEFTEKDFKKYLNIGKKTSENILENLDVGIRSMKDFEFVKGVGEEALKNIYKLAKLDLNNGESNKNQKFEQRFRPSILFLSLRMGDKIKIGMTTLDNPTVQI